MPTAFTHAAVGALLGQVLPRELRRAPIVLTLAAATTLPDLDVVTFRLGIPYADPFGHRGFSHSLLFAALVAILCAGAGLRSEALRSPRWWLLASVFFVSIASHGLLDAATDAGLGIGFFVPFDNERYFLSFRPIETASVSPLAFLLHWRRSASILANEMLWLWLPLLALSGLFQALRRLARIRAESPSRPGVALRTRSASSCRATLPVDGERRTG